MLNQKLVACVVGILIIGITLLAVTQKAHATSYISDNHGGRIGNFLDKYEKVRASGQNVIIDGECDSACTLVLSKIPASKICVMPNTKLGFHSPWNMEMIRGQPVMVMDRQSRRMMFKMYPAPVRKWISSEGGLPPPNKFIYLEGKALTRLYHPCGPAPLANE